MRTLKIDGELIELPEVIADHPYLGGRHYFRHRNVVIYGAYVADEKVTLKDLGRQYGLSSSAIKIVIARVARNILSLETCGVIMCQCGKHEKV